MSRQADAEAAVKAVRRYLGQFPALTEVVESAPLDVLGGPLAVIAGLAQLLNERALTAYGAVREARGLAPLIDPVPDTELLRLLVERVEPCGGDFG